MNCPICGRAFQPDESTAKPFCSERCRTIDLARWLDEGYALPESLDLEEEERESPPSDGDPT